MLHRKSKCRTTRTLTPVHERNLVRRYRKGDNSAAEELLRAHEGFLRQMARKYSRVQGYEFDDALQDARAGFVHGIQRFDTQRGIRLLTYAAWWARHYVRRAIENQVGDIRVPVWRQERHKVGPIRALRLDAPAHDGENFTLLETVAGSDVSPDEQADDRRRQERIRAVYRKAILSLDERERLIATARISRHERDRATLKEIGDRLGLSRERIRQIERKVEAKLRKRLTRMGARELVAA